MSVSKLREKGRKVRCCAYHCRSMHLKTCRFKKLANALRIAGGPCGMGGMKELDVRDGIVTCSRLIVSVEPIGGGNDVRLTVILEVGEGRLDKTFAGSGLHMQKRGSRSTESK